MPPLISPLTYKELGVSWKEMTSLRSLKELKSLSKFLPQNLIANISSRGEEVAGAMKGKGHFNSNFHELMEADYKLVQVFKTSENPVFSSPHTMMGFASQNPTRFSDKNPQVWRRKPNKSEI